MMMKSRHRVQSCNATDMDSQVQVEGRLLEWRKERLPLDDINVPVSELPDPEVDNGQTESLRQQESKWTDLALNTIQDNATDLGQQ